MPQYLAPAARRSILLSFVSVIGFIAGAAPIYAEQSKGRADEKLFHELHCIVRDGGRQTKAPVLDGVLAAGPGVDVAWAGEDVYPNLFLMKEPGVLRPVPTVGGGIVSQFPMGLEGETAFVCYDGRFIWVPMTMRAHPPKLYVIDPVDEAAYEISAAEGLPVVPVEPQSPSIKQFLLAAPVSPGKIVAAVLTREATRLAEVTFDPDAGGQARVIFEAREDGPTRADAEKLHFRFTPRPMTLLHQGEGASAQRRLLVGRATQRGNVSPLEFDPVDWSVKILDKQAPLYIPLMSMMGVHSLLEPDALYWLDLSTPGGRLSLKRAALPDLTPKTVVIGFPLGDLVREGGRIHCLGMNWSSWASGEKRVTTVSSSVPWKHRAQIGAAGNIDQTDMVFKRAWVSRHLGLLVTARSHVGRKTMFKLGEAPKIGAVADDEVAAPAVQADLTTAKADESPVQTKETDWALPEGGSASVLRLYASRGDARPLALLERGLHSSVIKNGERTPLLAHEITRQALLLAARESAGCLTRDAALGEVVPAKADAPQARFGVVSWFANRGPARFEISRIDADGKAQLLWQDSLPVVDDQSGLIDYSQLTEAAERWSREDFARLLRDAGFASPRAKTLVARRPSTDVEQWLSEMNFASQFAALRALHRADRDGGPSADWLGELARGYANLGLLSEFHWNGAHRALKARGLLYAQRLAAGQPGSPEGLWRRAYVKALAGLPDSALDDIEAVRVAFNDEPLVAPDWLKLIEAYCRSDADRLWVAAKTARQPQLAALLDYLRLRYIASSSLAIDRAVEGLRIAPDCLYLYDRLATDGGIDVERMAAEEGQSVLCRAVSQRLRKMAGVPPAVSNLIESGADEKSLTGGLAELLMDSRAAARDDDEFSWSFLGSMTRQVDFSQTCRLAHFMRDTWSVPVDEFVAEALPQFKAHAFQGVLALYSGADRDRWLNDLARRGDPSGLTWQRAAVVRRLLEKTPREEQPKELDALLFSVERHEDDVYDDVAGRGRYVGSENLGRLEKLVAIDPTCPHTIARRLAFQKELSREHGREWEDRYAADPEVLGALVAAYDKLGMDADADRVASERLKAAPDWSVYRQMADRLSKRGEMDKWKALWDEYLALPARGLEHAQVQVEIANYLIRQKRFAEAEPYASEAAETGAGWAMACAAQCYCGLGRTDEEGTWRARLAKRYPTVKNYGDYYLWARRTGHPEADAIWQASGKQIEAAMKNAPPLERFPLGLIHVMNHSRKKAFDIFDKAFETLKDDPNGRNFDGLLAALLADELAEKDSRERFLRAVARQADAGQAAFVRLAEALREGFAKDEKSPLDAARGAKLVTEAPAAQRPAISYLVGRVLDGHKHSDTAVGFYRAAAEQANRTAASCLLASARLNELQPGWRAAAAKP